MTRSIRILITGASGMLGAALVQELSTRATCIALCRSQPENGDVIWAPVDLLAEQHVSSTLERYSPEVIVHAAALTNVDTCERESGMAFALHVEATRTLAAYCCGRGAKLIYVSTDAVFDGKKLESYLEDDIPNPLQAYGRSKLAGEGVALVSPRALVLRTNIFGWRPRRHDSFAEWVLKSLREERELTMFKDVSFTPIATKLFAQVVARCIEMDLNGIYHAGGSEVVSKCEFAYRVASAYGLSTAPITPIRLEDRPLLAPRARNMALCSARLSAALGVSVPGLDASIRAWRETEPDTVRT